LAKKEAFKARDIALVRIEQLHPFPGELIRQILHKYKHKMLTLWIQEEPENMGAWRHIHHEFKDIEILPVARQPSGSPATGLSKIHHITQNEIIEKVFRPCICEHRYTYCGLTCADGSIREKILKQYRYLMDESKLTPKANI
jgi:2-oxoglutarate dehydrogenase E1 component